MEVNTKYHGHYIPGFKIGRLTIIGRVEDHISISGKHTPQYLCKCNCGNTIIVPRYNIQNGHAQSCGCIKKEADIKRIEDARILHGFSKTRIYSEYMTMINRCNTDYNSPIDLDSIMVCKEWYDPNSSTNLDGFREFHNWSIMNGYRDNLTIDRINVFGDYCPENCRWISIQDQQYNKSVSKYIIINGYRYPIYLMAKILGVDGNVFYRLVRKYNYNTTLLFDTVETPYGKRRYLMDWSRKNIIPINACFFLDKYGFPIPQDVYTDPEPIPALYVMDQRGFITGPMI